MANEVTVFCRNCGKGEPQGPKYCKHCGSAYFRTKAEQAAERSSQPIRPSPPQPASRTQAPGIVDTFKEAIINLLYPRRAPRQSRSTAPNISQPGSLVSQGVTQIPPPNPPHPVDSPAPLAPPALPVHQNINAKYRITGVFPLKTCNFYAVIDVNVFGQSQPIKPTYLIRETLTRPIQNPLPDLNSYQNLANDSSIKNVLRHLEIFQIDNRVYTVLQHPENWNRLQKQPVDKALAYTMQIGEALLSLNRRGYGGLPMEGKLGQEIVITINGHAYISDLTFVQRIQGASHADDAAGLASLFYYLLTGAELTAEAQLAPPQFSTVLRRAFSMAYPDVQLFLNDLQKSQEMPVYQRPLRQSKGYLTHVGRVRDHNEDFIGAFDLALDSGAALPIGLYIVADGMGGHAAGELASKGSVQQAFDQFIRNQILPSVTRHTRKLNEGEGAMPAAPADQIKYLVQEANRLVYAANQATNTNRGTTITAALIIGKQAYVANVGDSRTYLLRNGNLQQITEDHSLVYSLYKAGQIQKEEIYTHERKNEITRSLGDKADVMVDVFPVTLEPNDRLLLCSDGLWEMVRDPDIQRILMSAATPQMACDQLIQLANHNGGEDNVSAIVIALE